jgi:HAD superfamily hydrolase (TIGR01509 family)
MSATPQFEAVLFDCDGVLVDSEPITNGVLRDMLEELGWVLTPQACMDLFIGKAVKDERAIIEANTGRPLTDEWLAWFRERRNVALHEGLQAIANVHAAVHAVHAHHAGRIACASGADRFKVELQLQKVGLMDYFQGRIFSGHELPRSKPAPDVYLAAARALSVDPARCAVVEDTPTGVLAGVAAGATVFGYAPMGKTDVLMAAGAVHCFTDMAHLPVLVT